MKNNNWPFKNYELLQNSNGVEVLATVGVSQCVGERDG